MVGSRLKAVIHSEDASKSGAGYLEGSSKNTEIFYGYSNTLEKEILMIGFILNVIISAIMLVVIFYGFKKLMK